MSYIPQPLDPIAVAATEALERIPFAFGALSAALAVRANGAPLEPGRGVALTPQDLMVPIQELLLTPIAKLETAVRRLSSAQPERVWAPELAGNRQRHLSLALENGRAFIADVTGVGAVGARIEALRVAAVREREATRKALRVAEGIEREAQEALARGQRALHAGVGRGGLWGLLPQVRQMLTVGQLHDLWLNREHASFAADLLRAAIEVQNALISDLTRAAEGLPQAEKRLVAVLGPLAEQRRTAERRATVLPGDFTHGVDTALLATQLQKQAPSVRPEALAAVLHTGDDERLSASLWQAALRAARGIVEPLTLERAVMQADGGTEEAYLRGLDDLTEDAETAGPAVADTAFARLVAIHFRPDPSAPEIDLGAVGTSLLSDLRAHNQAQLLALKDSLELDEILPYLDARQQLDEAAVFYNPYCLEELARQGTPTPPGHAVAARPVSAPEEHDGARTGGGIGTGAGPASSGATVDAAGRPGQQRGTGDDGVKMAGALDAPGEEAPAAMSAGSLPFGTNGHLPNET